MHILIEQLKLDSQKFIPIEELSSERILYWRCLATFMKNENFTEEFDQIIPELSPFCTYIKSYITMINNRANKQYEQITQHFILHQLFEMVKLHDLADEMGRKNLKELILDTLQTFHCSEKTSQCIVEYFEKVVPDVNNRVAQLVEVINEIRMPSRISTQIPTMTEDERHERKMMVKQIYLLKI